jgi:hypothetical protein
LDRALLPETQPGDDASIAIHIAFLQVIQQSPPLADKLQEPPAGMVIFLVHLEMLRQILDAGTEEGNLHFRGTGVSLMELVALDDVFSLLRI